MMAIQGPRSRGNPPAAGRPRPGFHALLSGGLVQLLHPAAERQGGIISRTGYTGEDGFELSVGSDIAAGVWQAILDLGRPLGLIPPAWRPRYLAAGSGHAAVRPRVERADRSISGRLGLCLSSGGLRFSRPRRLVEDPKSPLPAVRVGLELAGRRPAREGYPICMDGQPLGTSPAGPFRPPCRSRSPWAMCGPRRPPPGASLAIDIRGRLEEARVVELPFYRRQKKKELRSDAEKLLYAKTHEWVARRSRPGRREDRHRGTFGLRPAGADRPGLHATAARGPPVKAGEPFGEIESVKAVSDLYSPVDGEIVAANSDIVQNLPHLADDPYGDGWLVKIRVGDAAGLSRLMNKATYQKQCEEEAH